MFKRTTTKNTGILDPFVVLFSITLFLSAALMFTVEPMVGKMMLPIIGGAPTGWLVTMTFFQAALLGGYFLAHIMSRWSPRAHMTVIGLLLASGLLLLPLHLNADLLTATPVPESLAVALMLGAALTLPAIGLAALSPSLQRLFGHSSSTRSREPYFLFAASNLGSFGGLLAYPLWIERVSGLSSQTDVWRWGYVALIALCALCVLVTRREAEGLREERQTAAVSSPAITWRARALWVLLAFIPSSLMMGATAHVTAETGSIPFFWVLPLALYLLTFVQAFRQQKAPAYRHLLWLQPLSVALLILPLLESFFGSSASYYKMAVVLVAFYLTARLLHGWLAERRPAKEQLTSYYLWVAVGGVLGGLFNTFLAPFIFSVPLEFTLVAWGSCFVHLMRPRLSSPSLNRWVLGSSLAALGLTLAIMGTGQVPHHEILDIAFRVLLIAALIIVSVRPWWLAILLLALGLIFVHTKEPQQTLVSERNFFGVLHVREKVLPGMTVRRLVHGTTVHGEQKVKPEIDTTPHCYYGADGPLGDMMAQYQPKDIGVIGLGAGTTMCYQAPGRHFTVYEIDPDVVTLASTWFDYFRVCGTPSLRIGDGRKMLEKEKEARYDLLILDAFTADFIPAHLLTREALALYFNRLQPDGVLGIHISNVFFNLNGPLSNVVKALGVHALTKKYVPEEKLKQVSYPSEWVIIAKSQETLEPLLKRGWQALPPPQGRAWTDDYSDTLSALRIFSVNSPDATTKSTAVSSHAQDAPLNAQTH